MILKKDATLLWTVLILLFTAVIFINGMATLATWQDEAYTITASQEPNLAKLLELTERDNHPQLFTILLFFWRKIAGDQLVALRLSGYLFSILTVAITFRLALDFFDQKARRGG